MVKRFAKAHQFDKPPQNSESFQGNTTAAFL